MFFIFYNQNFYVHNIIRYNLFINDIIFSIKYSNILLLPYDANIFKRIRNTTDTELLQQNLTSFQNWCISNGMSLNINKC